MGNLNKFQIIVIGIVLLLVLTVVLITSGIIPGLEEETDQPAKLTLWGFDEPAVWNEVLSAYRDVRSKVDINYQQKNRESFEDELLNSISRGQSPDVIVFPSYDLGKHADKLSAAPPILITEREIEQQYIDAGRTFVTSEKHVLGIPLFADALILFYNKDLFTKSFITLPPATWDEFLESAQKLTTKTPSGEISVAGAALGRAHNIKNAPLILTSLFLQSGERIIGNNNKVVLGEPIGPAESAMRFFGDFANQRKTSYTWSFALPEAADFFLAGKLGMYFGLMSEFDTLLTKNPHLVFSVSPIPTFTGAPRTATAGTLFAAAVPKASRNWRQAWSFAVFLGNKETAALYAEQARTVSVRRDVLPTYASDLVKSVFAKSVLSLALWPDPDTVKSDAILRTLIEEAAQGRLTIREALEKANAQLSELIKQ